MKIKCAISEVELISDDVLLIDIKPECSIEVEDVLELKQAAEELGGGRRLFNVIKVGPFTLPSKLARELSCSPKGSEFKKADAFVLNSLAQKIIANFMVKVNNPVVPTKHFSSEDEALEWIECLRQKEQGKLVFDC